MKRIRELHLSERLWELVRRRLHRVRQLRIERDWAMKSAEFWEGEALRYSQRAEFWRGMAERKGNPQRGHEIDG